MKLYLIQHGKAKSEKEDIARPLNSEGVEQTKIVAEKFLNKNLTKPDIIFCSNKLRAKQTAEILNDYIKPLNGIKEVEGLNPNDEIQIWLDKIKELNKDIMIVGHLPHLKKFCAFLVYNDENNNTINFFNSCMICLEKKGDKWQLFDTILPDSNNI